MRKIRRTWYSAKKKAFITKEYTYGKSTGSEIKSENTLLVSKKHGRYDKRIDEILNAVDPAMRAEYEATIKKAVRKGERLSVKGLMSKTSKNRIEKMFINAGYSEEDIIRDTGVSIDELYDSNNWKGDVFTTLGGTSYRFNWGYTGGNLVKI